MFEAGDGSHILFNARTLAIAKISKDIADQLNGFPLMIDDIEHLEKMQNGGFVVENDFDEKAFISRQFWRSREEKSVCSLTIAPTLGCNFNCFYCFESEEVRAKYDKMTDYTQDQVIQFLEKRFVACCTKKLDVCWFGGEPLLALDTIQSLSAKIIALCKKLDIEFDNAQIITNGYKLNKKTADILSDLRITSAQVTIDGPEHIHDSRRVLKGGKGSFQRVISNLIKASESLHILVRVNIDQQNKNHLELFAEQLKSNIHDNPNIQVVLAPVVESPHVKKEYQTGVSRKEFAQVDEYFFDIAKLKKIKTTRSMDLVSNACGADHRYSYMIGPKGELYHCWEDFGNQDLAVGDVIVGRTKNLDYIEQYYDFDPTKHDKCTDCRVMPLCMGGCPKQRLIHNEPQCGVFKFKLKEHVFRKISKLSPILEESPVVAHQINRISSNSDVMSQFHVPYSNNYVLTLIPKSQDQAAYIETIATQTRFLNNADMTLLRACKELLKDQVTDDLYHWAAAIKNKVNLKGVDHAIKVIHYIEEHILHERLYLYLNKHKPKVLSQFLDVPLDQLNIIRVNGYYSFDIATLLLEKISQNMVFDHWQNAIDRVEIAKEGHEPSKTNHSHFPTLILYIKKDSLQSEKTHQFFDELREILDHYKGHCPNLEYSFKWLNAVTVTQGYRLYKQYLKALGLLERVYHADSSFAFCGADQLILNAILNLS